MIRGIGGARRKKKNRIWYMCVGGGEEMEK
jgi:hypothetical protein